MLCHNQNVSFHVIPVEMVCFQFREWKSNVQLRYFILILNHTNISTGITWKWNKISVFRHNRGGLQPCWIQFGIVDVTIPRDRDSHDTLRWRCLLGCPHPCQWQEVLSQEPHWSWYKLDSHSRVGRCHLLFVLGVSCGHATPLRFYLQINVSNRRKSPAVGPTG